MDQFWIDIAFTVLLRTIKNADARAKMRGAFLKVYRSIKIAYAGDPDFE